MGEMERERMLIKRGEVWRMCQAMGSKCTDTSDRLAMICQWPHIEEVTRATLKMPGNKNDAVILHLKDAIKREKQDYSL